jgi:uncharacterized protein YbjT (DUF2867 family)
MKACASSAFRENPTRRVPIFVVAGVTGHVGSVVAKELLAKGQKVRVLVRDAAKGAEWSKRGAEVAVGSIDDVVTLTAALQGAKGAFVLLPPNFAVPDFYAYQRSTATTIGTAVKAAHVPHVVMLSSIGADLPDGNGPIKGLYHLEAALRTSGTKLTAIRAGYFMENIASSLEPAKQMGIYPNFTPSADYPMPMIATKDIGALAAKSLVEGAAKNEIIDLNGPAYSTRQMAEKLGAALVKTLQIVDVPEPGWVDAMMKGGLPKQVAEAFAEMYRDFGSGLIAPKGDRAAKGATTLDEVVKALVH